jgi:hypothetical protein
MNADVAPNVNSPLDVFAAEIAELKERVQNSQNDTLDANRQIGDKLLAAKAMLDNAGKGAFGEWVEGQGFNFSRQWRSQLMKLAANWKAIDKAMKKSGPVKSVEAALKLISKQAITKAELPALLKLQALTEGGGNETEVENAGKKLKKAAKDHNMDEEEFLDKLTDLKAKQDAPKETPAATIAKLVAQIERLTALLAAKGIDPDTAPSEAPAA